MAYSGKHMKLPYIVSPLMHLGKYFAVFSCYGCTGFQIESFPALLGDTMA